MHERVESRFEQGIRGTADVARGQQIPPSSLRTGRNDNRLRVWACSLPSHAEAGCFRDGRRVAGATGASFCKKFYKSLDSLSWFVLQTGSFSIS